MPRSYRHVSDYEKEIFALRIKGYTNRAIGEALGLNEEQIKNFIKRYNRKQRKIAAGEVIHKKGKPNKKGNELPPSIQQLDKLSQMRYVMASKDRYIKRLEMENELMRDFLSLTERK